MAQAVTELQNFAALITEEVNNLLNESGDGGFREAAFAGLVMDYLAEANETGNVQVCTAVHRNKASNRLRQMNGYALWDDFESLDIFIADYRGDGQVYTLEKARINSAFNLISRYLEFAWKGEDAGIEDSANEKEFLENFGYHRDRILRVRLILLTDGVIRDKEDLPEPKTALDGVTITKEVWDLDRICTLWSSGRKREPIMVDVPRQFGHQIEVLPIDHSRDGYSAYLCIIPGMFLAQLYEDYGSRLLEKNVRVYLQNKGKVNKGIRKTIAEDPGMFMAYNNGISATAEEISFARQGDSGRLTIMTIKGLQIVNGGQTTSSIYYAWKQDHRPIDGIYLQMKITVIRDEARSDLIIGRISKYANSQTKVTEIDFTSNQSFHILLEELSRTTWTPSVAGSSLHTRWYYERTKGQYQEDLNKMRKSRDKQNFKDKNPMSQVIRKEEFAKYRNSWKMLPHWVARASQKNYLQFLQEEEGGKPDRGFFKETVAIAILFKAAEKRYGKKPDAMGDLRYIVVPYALAWLNHHTQGRINLQRIWLEQDVPEELFAVLEGVLKKVNDFIQNNQPAAYALVSEWAKKEECWHELKQITPADWGIDLRSLNSCLAPEGKEKEDKNYDNETAVRAVSRAEWEDIEISSKVTGLLNLLQIGVVRNVVRRLEKGKPLSQQLIDQAQKVLEIVKGQEA